MRLLLLLLLAGCPSAAPDRATQDFVAVTFNTGTTEGILAGAGENGGYGAEQAAASDAYYGDGLAWRAFVDEAAQWFETIDPDVVAFQEIFWSGDCPEVPEEARAGFVCETWQEGDPTVAQLLLGAGYQVACHPGHPDKCLAVHERFGTFAGCEGDFCLEGLGGSTIEGCGQGARVGRGRLEPRFGDFVPSLSLVDVHGSSGLSQEDEDCRVAQVDQVFLDLGDGDPAADGDVNLVLGDFNTDPGRWAEIDASAARWNDFAGEGRDFAFLSPVGDDAPRSYGGLADIDHVLSDHITGSCAPAGMEGRPGPLEEVFFDHHPMVCDLRLTWRPSLRGSRLAVRAQDPDVGP